MKRKFRCASFVMVFLAALQCNLNGKCYIVNAYVNENYWQGYNITNDGFVYEENSNGVTLFGYTGLDYSNMKMPSQINNKAVTKIADRFLSSNKQIVDITIPDTVMEIGKNAFSYCENLKSIKLPEALIKIDKNCFRDCTSLEKIILPSSLTSIESMAFYGCNNLQSLNIPSNLNRMGDSCFSGCSRLNNIIVPGTLKNIPEGAFQNCSSLTNISINEGTETIGANAFSRCKSLKKLILPDSINQIYRYAFSKCDNLEEINIPKGVNEMQCGIFSECRNLSSIEILKNVTSIYYNVFDDVDQSKFIINGFQDSYVHSFATKNGIKFNDIGNDSSNNIYNGINKDIILNDNNLVEYNKLSNDIKTTIIAENYKENNNSDWYKEILIKSIITDNSSDKNKAYDNNKINEQLREIPTSLIEKIYYDSPLKIFIENTENFSEYALYEELSSDTIAFFSPAKNTIYLSPESESKEGVLVHEMGHFYDSYILGGNNKKYYSEQKEEFLNIFNSKEKIELFGENNIHYVNNVREYFAECFKYYFIYRDTLEEKAPKTYDFINNLLKNYTDDTNYKNHNWDKNNSSHSGEDNSEDIVSKDFDYSKDDEGITICAYKGNDNEVVVPDTIENIPVTKIKGSAFERNNNITSIKLPDSITEILSFAFYECKNLKLINMPKSLIKIGSCAFSKCSNLEKVDIPEGVTTIGCQAFSGCSKLKKVSMPSSLTSIEGYAFTECTSLEEIIIPEGVNAIKDNTFSGCTQLKNIQISKNLNSIGESAFLNCNNELIINGCMGSYTYVFAKKHNIKFNNISEEPIEIIFEGNDKIIVLDNKELKEYSKNGYLIKSTILNNNFSNDNSIESLNNYKILLINSMITDSYSNNDEKYNIESINKEIQVLPKSIVEKLYDSTLNIYLEDEKVFNNAMEYEGLDKDTIAFYSSKNNTMHFTKSSMEKEGVYLHEIGHFYDSFILGNNSGKAFCESDSKFLSIFNCGEKDKLFSEEHYKNDIKEYFAECFKYYYIYRDTLKEKAPKTYKYFASLMKDYENDEPSVDHNWNAEEDNILDDEDNTTSSGDKSLEKVVAPFILGAIIIGRMKKKGL